MSPEALQEKAASLPRKAFRRPQYLRLKRYFPTIQMLRTRGYSCGEIAEFLNGNLGQGFSSPQSVSTALSHYQEGVGK